MTWKRWLITFLIFLFFFPLIPLVNAGGPDIPFEEHPWEEVKSTLPPKSENPELVPTVNSIYFFSVSPVHSAFFVLVVEKKCQGEVKKEQSAKTVSLPRKK
jgi:hypothetical protein